jgi:magnesium chelatase family protein
MLARRLTTMLPAMSLAEALETTRMPRVAGRTGARTALVTTRPCRAPHHTIAEVGLIGGGQVPLLGGLAATARGGGDKNIISATSLTSPSWPRLRGG